MSFSPIDSPHTDTVCISVAGASRFERWLDDMPTAGWGYGALTSNRTNDFLALFYGQAATYHSRGTFHTTEQLSYKGEGHYRDFLHMYEKKLIFVLSYD